MKTFLIIILLFVCTNISAQRNAVRLNSNSEVTNSIFYQNLNSDPLPADVTVTFSASDLVLHGSNNIHLQGSPFSNGYKINSTSDVYNRGNRLALDAWDTLDLDYSPRVSCDEIDMGAYEFDVIKTRIINHPILSDRVCEGYSMFLSVDAEGTNLSYQWQRNGENISGMVTSTFGLNNVTIADTGFYRVIVYGDCCNDTSAAVRLDIDCEPLGDTLDIHIEFANGCHNGEGRAMAVVTGGFPPYTYAWSNGSTDSLIENLQSGNYVVFVADSRGSEQSKDVTIDPVSELQIFYQLDQPNNQSCDGGNIYVIVDGGTPEYFYEWYCHSEGENFSPSQNLLNVKAGTYELLVTDAEGCQKSVEITLSCLFRRVLPSLFISPNNDGKNDYLDIKYIELYPRNIVIILNSYGEEVVRLQNYNNTDVVWRGRNSRGQAVPDGTYYYIIEAEGVAPMAGWLLLKESKQR